MARQVIFPQDWVNVHPYKQADDVDRYYCQLAGRVYQKMAENPQCYSHDVLGDMKEVAIYLTCWFEDIISGTNIWRTVNQECQRRYGKMLPFYDTTEYYEGEANVSDLRLLLWYYAEWQCENKRLFNPENPAIEALAELQCPIFDEAYPDAPENERLRDFLLQPELTNDYWKTREVMNWFGTSSFIMIHPLQRIVSHIEENANSRMDLQQQMYMEHMQYVFRERHNLLSFTTAEWLTAIRSDLGKDEILPKMVQTNLRLLEVQSVSECDILVKDLCMETEYTITRDSWLPTDAFQQKVHVGMKFVANTIPFGDTNYQCGILTETQSAKPEDFYNITPPDQSYLYEDWLRLSKGEPVVFFANSKERDKLLQQLRLTKGDDVSFPKTFDHGAIGYTREGGLCFVNGVEGICCKKNPFYNKEKAQKNAHMFFCAPSAAPYEVCRSLFETGWLPDAGLNSLHGDEYGRQFLQEHGQFLMDYFHEKHA